MLKNEGYHSRYVSDILTDWKEKNKLEPKQLEWPKEQYSIRSREAENHQD